MSAPRLTVYNPDLLGRDGQDHVAPQAVLRGARGHGALGERGRGDEASELDEAADAVRSLPEHRRERESRAILLKWGRKSKRRLFLLVTTSTSSSTASPTTSSGSSARCSRRRASRSWGQRALAPRDLRVRAPVPRLMLSDLRNTPEVREIVLGDRGRIETLRVLTGGNPRAIVLVHQVLARAEERTTSRRSSTSRRRSTRPASRTSRSSHRWSWTRSRWRGTRSPRAPSRIASRCGREGRGPPQDDRARGAPCGRGLPSLVDLHPSGSRVQMRASSRQTRRMRWSGT